MPDYEIICWNEDNFDYTSVPFVKEAYEQKKWAFVADYVRLYALFHYGGIYLDTDSEVYKSFDFFLDNDFFAGTDCWDPSKTQFAISAGFMGASISNSYIKRCMEYYENAKFILDDGRLNIIIIPDILSSILEPYGYKREDNVQVCIYDNLKIKIYSTHYFVNNFYQITKDTYAKHWGEDSWGLDHRGKLFHLFRKYDLMFLYKGAECIMRKFRK